MSEFRFSPRPNRAAEIDWLPWGPVAFERAKAQGKPVLLSISAVWCHWCHVMDETTYSDEAVIRAIRERFVPVRVDNDERPDVNVRYNMGGWPTTAFLADDGATLAGATYLPPEQMREVLGEVSAWYDAHRDEIRERIASASKAPEPAPQAAIDAGVADRIVAAIASTYDAEFGGFGDAPKFPQAEALETLLVEALARGDAALHAMVVKTLLAMATGGTYDRVEGGFFRYSTTRDWSVPHFEKMAEDHAGLIRVLALLLIHQAHPQLRATLVSALDYVTTVLLDASTGFFAGSQDADEAYYALPLEQRRAVPAPFVDRTLYADRNAALAGALALASVALDDDRARRIATAALDGLHEQMRDSDGLLLHVRRTGEAPAVQGLLADQAAYVRALLDAHEAGGAARFLERAARVTSAVLERFLSDSGALRDRIGGDGGIGRLSIAHQPPAENALVAESLLRLEQLCADRRYRTEAESLLRAQPAGLANAGTFAAPYARALRRFTSPNAAVRIVGDADGVDAFREAAHRLASPFVAIRTVAPSEAPSLALPAQPAPAAYVCRGITCGAPVRDAAEIRAAFDAISA